MAKDVKISLRLDEEVKQKLEDLAQEQDMSVSQIVRAAIKQYIQKKEE